MADRVFFTTRNESGTPEDSSGFNGFPWKVPATAPSPQVGAPNWLPFIVREWSVSGDFSATLTLSSSPTREREIYLMDEARWEDEDGNYLLLEYGADLTVRASFFRADHPEYGVLYSESYDDSFSFGDDVTTGLIGVVPTLFWPYVNSNGDPIYDTATGAQIRDPLN